MLTVKLFAVDCNGNFKIEQVFEARAVNKIYKDEKESSLLIYPPNPEEEVWLIPMKNKREKGEDYSTLYVMNRNGSTVATYSF